jgi:hypothetical protein
MTEYEQSALNKIRESYSASKPVVEAIMANQERVAIMISMLRGAVILSAKPTMLPDGVRPIIDYLDAINGHLECMATALGAMYSVAMAVNAMLSEHEEDETIEGVNG